MRRRIVALSVAAVVIAALTWGMCMPLFQTRCIVRSDGAYLAWRGVVGFPVYYDIYPGLSIATWGMIEWQEIDSIQFREGMLGPYLTVHYTARGERRTLDLGPFDRTCAAAVRGLLANDPKFSSR